MLNLKISSLIVTVKVPPAFLFDAKACGKKLCQPLSGGKRRALLRQILVPDRCKLQDPPAGLEKWEELVRRCERSKSGGTTTTALDEDVKTAALEALVPSELEQHLVTNRHD